MKKVILFIMVVLSMCGIVGCTASKTVKTENQEVTQESKTEVKKEYTIKMELKSSALSNNVLGENTNQNVYISLPPSYYDGTKNYPVIYMLHGFGDQVNGFISTYKTELDQMFKKGTKEFIIVCVNGTNKTGGSFYANSPIIGNWEDYLVNEVVDFVDSNFHTIDNRNSRAIGGFSMGGTGAINSILKHPDIFSSAFIMSPGLLSDNGLASLLRSWETSPYYYTAYGQAFSPNMNNKDYCDIPTIAEVDSNSQVVKNWMNGFGNLSEKIDTCLTKNYPIKGIKITYGTQDSYSWIPEGCKALSEKLKEKGVPYSIDSFSGGHKLPPKLISDYFVPFFEKNLEY